MADLPLLRTRGLSKKFSRDIRANMRHGLLDLISPRAGRENHLRLRPGEELVLDNLDIDLFAGEIVCIIGANGSGKTTLMRLLSGIYLPDAGSIEGRKNLRTTSIFALRSGMEPLYTGLENVYLKGALFGMPREEIAAKIEFIRDFSELGDRLDLPFGNYSSGMKARLGYAIALATDPDVFLIDESLAVGDSAFKKKCFANMKEMVASGHKSVLFVTNHMAKVRAVASRVIVLHEGRIAKNSHSVDEAIEYYSSLFGKDQAKIRRAR